MKPIIVICIAIVGILTSAHAQSYDEELGKLSTGLGSSLEKAGLKTVAVGGFKDLNGKETGLGKLLIEDLSVDLVNQNKGVSVVDRANLSRLMDEYKLTEEGLIDPANTKKLKLEGIDAIIFGAIVPFENTYRVQLKAIATDSAKVVAATRGSITETESLDTLMGVTKLRVKAPIEAGKAEQQPPSSPVSVTPSEVKRIFNLRNITIEIKSVAFFRKSGKVRIIYSATNKFHDPLAFAYNIIDKNASNDGRYRLSDQGYKADFKLQGEATDDKGQSYNLLLPNDAQSTPTMPSDAELNFTVEYQVIAEPDATIQIPESISFSLEFYAGYSAGLRDPSNLYKFSAADFPIGKLY